MATITERFWRKVKKAGNGECWLWTAARFRSGYGAMQIGTLREPRTETAHRLSWKIHFGDIPAGLHVCHRCDTPACVNPAHLFLGTPADNLQDAASKGRMPHGLRHHASKLTPEAVNEIRTSDLPARVLAYRYNVTRETIYRARSRKAWTHV